MIEILSSFTLVAAILVPAPAPAAAVNGPGPLARAAQTYVAPAGAMAARRQQPARDSLKNGAIIGAVAGGVSFAVLGSAGCALGGLYGGESDCTGPLIGLTAAGAGLGALIGVGVDALFERAPSTAGTPGGMRKGIRLRVRF